VTPKYWWRVGAGVASVVLVGLTWFALQVYPLGGPGKLVIVTVHPGDSISTIAGEMHAKGVIASPLALRIDTLLFGALNVQPGSYEIAQHSSFAHVKAIFGAKPNVLVVQVSPGLTLHEVAQQLAANRGTTYANAFLAATTAAASVSPYNPDLSPPALAGYPGTVNPLEGLVGIGTYVVPTTESAAALAAKMQAAFTSQAASVGLTPGTRVDGLSAYQIVIAASIVEREGYYTVNMPQVGRVILNRLQRGGGLQMDSTIKYPLGMDSGAVTSAMLAIHSPYNTYLSSGLTPTPICSVSMTALRAVLHAPPGPWLYFMLYYKNGGEKFAATFKEQLKNEAVVAKKGLQ